jgi:hypothetical protein
MKLKKKKLNLFLVRSAIWSSGIQAIKTRKVKGETGHATYNKIPERKAKPGNCIFFNQKKFGGNFGKRLILVMLTVLIR